MRVGVPPVLAAAVEGERIGQLLPAGWEPQDELQQLLDRQADLKQDLSAKKQALQEAQRHQRNTLTRQIRRAQARVSAADRKRRTRRLILIGSYIDSVSQADPVSMTRLMKGLDEFLERDQDRALFNLPPRPKDA